MAASSDPGNFTNNMDIKRSAAGLARVLQADLVLARQLLAALNDQSAALLANSHAQASAAETDMRQIAAQQAETGRLREEAVRQLAASAGALVPTGTPAPSLSQVLRLLPAVETRSILTFRAELLRVEKAVQSAMARNRPLLENALEMIRITMEAMTRAATKTSRYGGGSAMSAPTFYIDQKA
jgi:hypothetical protein